MNFDQANEWLHNNNLKSDLEIVSDASKKWKGRKLVVQEGNNHIPSTCKTGKDLIEFINLFKELLELIIKRSEKDLQKHLDLIEVFLESCVDKKSILKSNSELQNISKFVDSVQTSFEKLEQKFSKYNVIFRLKDTYPFYTAEELVENNTTRWETPSINMLEGLPLVAKLTLDHNLNQNYTNIIFTKDEMKELSNLINGLSKFDFSNTLIDIWKNNKNINSRFSRAIDRLKLKLNQIDNKDMTEMRIIDGMIENLSDDDIVTEYEDSHQIIDFQDNVIAFVMMLREVVKLMERTDSWIKSKNV